MQRMLFQLKYIGISTTKSRLYPFTRTEITHLVSIAHGNSKLTTHEYSSETLWVINFNLKKLWFSI